MSHLHIAIGAVSAMCIVLGVVTFWSGASTTTEIQLQAPVGFNAATAVQALYDGAEDLGELGWDPVYGWGRLDICGAFDAAGMPCTIEPTPISVGGIAELPLLEP